MKTLVQSTIQSSGPECRADAPFKIILFSFWCKITFRNDLTLVLILPHITSAFRLSFPMKHCHKCKSRCFVPVLKGLWFPLCLWALGAASFCLSYGLYYVVCVFGMNSAWYTAFWHRYTHSDTQKKNRFYFELRVPWASVCTSVTAWLHIYACTCAHGQLFTSCSTSFACLCVTGSVCVCVLEVFMLLLCVSAL